MISFAHANDFKCSLFASLQVKIIVTTQGKLLMDFEPDEEIKKQLSDCTRHIELLPLSPGQAETFIESMVG